MWCIPVDRSQSTFYWAIEAPRRFLLKTAFSICTVLLSVGSEFAQAFLPNERSFDPIDIVANVVGSLLALTLCSWYHGRMLERKRRRKLEGRGLLNDEFEERDDLELGEGGASGQEIGLQERSGEGDEETAEAWDEIGGSEGGSEVAGHGAVAKAAKD